MKPGLCLMLLLAVVRAAVGDDSVPPSGVGTNLSVQASPTDTNALKNLVLKRGFRLEVIASEPLIKDPIALAFDGSRRLFVLEAAHNSEDATPSGSLRILEDNDGNGVFDTSKVYADNLPMPTALAGYGGGVFVATAGQIIYLKDTDGDGRADMRQEVFKSFDDATNGALKITGLTWGLDNRFHVATTSPGGAVISGNSPPQSVILTNGNFAFDPRTFILSPERGSGEVGVCFDNRGHPFVCDLKGQIYEVMYGNQYAAQNPFYEMPPPLFNLPRNRAAKFLYPADAQISTTTTNGGSQNLNLRPSSSVPIGGIDSFTIYRGNAFPADYLGDVFLADPVHHLIHHDKIRPDGMSATIEHPTDETGIEFLASKDSSFQPVQVINGPDGALYIAARAPISKNSAATTKASATNTPSSGRIFRVVAANFKSTKPVQLEKLSGDQLVQMLRHPNGWDRDTASRLLYERQDRSTVTPLIRLLYDPLSPALARLHALHTLADIQFSVGGRPGRGLSEAHVRKALGDTDDRLREHAILLAERFLSDTVSDGLWRQLMALARDASPRVRYQLALTLGRIQHPGKGQALAQMLSSDPSDLWLRAAVLCSLNDGADEMFGLLMGDANLRNSDAGRDFLASLIQMAGARNQRVELAVILNDLGKIPEAQPAFALAREVVNSAQYNDNSLAALDTGNVLGALYTRAAVVALDPNASENARVEALDFAQLADSIDASFAVGLVNQWPALKPRVRRAALVCLLSRPILTAVLLEAATKDIVSRADFSSVEIKFLLGHRDASLRQIAIALFSGINDQSRRTAANRFLSAYKIPGNAAHGQQIFLAKCAKCHQIAGQGNPNGLSFNDRIRSNKEALLRQILHPNQVARPFYPETLVETADGKTLIGFVTRHTTKSTTLCDANGLAHSVGKSSIRYEGSLGFSGMPEGLEDGLSLQDMADLLEFVTTHLP